MTVLDVSQLPGGWVSVRPRSYHVAVRDQMRVTPGASWDPLSKSYKMPYEAAIIVLRTLKQAGVATHIGDLGTPFDFTSFVTSDSNMGAGLYSYQRAGVEFALGGLAKTGAVLLADDPGLGKSAQALRALSGWIDIVKSVAVVCPAVVKTHWLEQHKKWGGPPVISVTSYDKLRSEHGRGGSPLKADAVVLDEIHYISNSKSGRSQAVRALLGQTPRPLVVGLSGTPMQVRPKDLWNPLDTLFPGRFGSWGAFTRRWCNGHKVFVEGAGREVWDCDGSSNAAELAERLKAVMLRRAKSEVLELPEKQRITIPLELPERALRQLQKAAADVSDETGVVRVLSQCESHKLAHATELASDLLAQGRRVLVFTTRKESARLLAAELEAPCITGEVSADARVGLTEGAPCVCATVYSMTTGIDLTDFDTVIFVGLDWVPSTLLQAEARIHRIGQHRAVSYYYLVALGTLDEVVRERVIERLETFEAVVGGGADGTALAASLAGGVGEDLLTELVSCIRSQLTP